MVERLEPRAEKKLPSMSISLGFKLLAIATEKRPATATSSHPVRLLKKQENSWQFIRPPVYNITRKQKKWGLFSSYNIDINI